MRAAKWRTLRQRSCNSRDIQPDASSSHLHALGDGHIGAVEHGEDVVVRIDGAARSHRERHDTSTFRE